MSHCHLCGAPLPAGARFCSQCGAPAVSLPTPKAAAQSGPSGEENTPASPVTEAGSSLPPQPPSPPADTPPRRPPLTPGGRVRVRPPVLGRAGADEPPPPPAVPAKQPEKQWHYRPQGQTDPAGPVGEAQLRQWLAVGHLQGDDLVWTTGLQGWVSAAAAGLAPPPPEPPKTPDVPPVLPPPPPPPEMAPPVALLAPTCPKCGQEVADQARFCRHCGEAINAAAPAPPPDRCPRCQEPISPGARFCRQCGASLPAPAGAAPLSQAQPVIPGQAYAGFWWRALALSLDAVLVGLVFGGFSLIVFGPMAASPFTLMEYSGQALPYSLLNLVFVWLYFALAESSVWQATPGKKALGLKVTDLAGRRLSFARASARTLAKYLSGLILGIGYFMAGFTRRKQALHDLLAGCLVWKIRP